MGKWGENLLGRDFLGDVAVKLLSSPVPLDGIQSVQFQIIITTENNVLPLADVAGGLNLHVPQTYRTANLIYISIQIILNQSEFTKIKILFFN